MVDLGVKPNSNEAEPIEVRSRDKEPRYPSVTIDNPPDFLAEKSIESKCRVEIVIEIMNQGVDEYSDRKLKETRIKILGMKYISSEGKKTKEEYLNMDDNEREEYDQPKDEV
ncbi:MAG: hypothetical protein J7L96_03515 [Bacteroidales bacterium]|nr:hypothetical protein [Bacteroidales bacterium]